MYATLVMKIYELAKKLGKPEIAKKHLEEGITKCKEKKFLETFSHYLEKLQRPQEKNPAEVDEGKDQDEHKTDKVNVGFASTVYETMMKQSTQAEIYSKK